MTASRDDIMADVLGLLRKLADDWEYTGDITPETRFFTDMGMRSLDLVILGTAIQEHYNRVFPFARLFSHVGQRELPDVPVGEWVDFIYQNFNAEPPLARRAETGAE